MNVVDENIPEAVLEQIDTEISRLKKSQDMDWWTESNERQALFKIFMDEYNKRNPLVKWIGQT